MAHTPRSLPKLYVCIDNKLADRQGWGQFIPHLKERMNIQIIGSHVGSPLYKRWRRIESLLIKYYLPLHPRTPVYFAWGDPRVGVVKPRKNFFATIHQPKAKWPAELGAWSEQMGGIHVLSDEDEAALRDIAPKANIRTILHGIGTSFWKPADNRPAPALHIVYSGQYMRNLAMFFRVVERLHAEFPTLKVSTLFNPGYTLPDNFPNWINRVSELSPDELLEFYRSATLMFMPYDNVTASNSICEALGCGLPIVSTRVGGMPSYARGGGMVLVENNDDDAAFEACSEILRFTTVQTDLARQARNNALSNLEWGMFASQLADFIQGQPSQVHKQGQP